jgi:heme exporter protein A
MLVEVRDLWKAYRPGAWVLRGLNLVVEPGEVVAIVGPNGSGKTTLLRILAGLLRPSRGDVKVCGYEPWSLQAKRCRGVVLHHSLLYDELTVEENLRLYAALHGVKSYSISSDSVAAMLGLARVKDVPVGWLSFGWRKRADILRALVHRPNLLLIDEPFTGLDEVAAEVLAKLLEDLSRQGTGIIATSPRTDERLLSLADSVYELVNGKLVKRR